MNKKTLLLLLIICVTAFVGYIVSSWRGCPTNNQVALEQYRTNQPVLSEAGVAKANQQAIADKLVQQWFAQFKSSQADRGIRIEDFEIDQLEIEPTKDNSDSRLVAAVSFAVKPTRCSATAWIAGNGVEAGSWIKEKFLFFEIIKERDYYKIDHTRTGP